jgi:hypothetical protein
MLVCEEAFPALTLVPNHSVPRSVLGMHYVRPEGILGRACLDKGMPKVSVLVSMLQPPGRPRRAEAWAQRHNVRS